MARLISTAKTVIVVLPRSPSLHEICNLARCPVLDFVDANENTGAMPVETRQNGCKCIKTAVMGTCERPVATVTVIIECLKAKFGLYWIKRR